MKDYPLIKFVILFIAGILAGSFLHINILIVYIIVALIATLLLINLLFNKSQKVSPYLILLTYTLTVLCGYVILQNYNRSNNDILPEKLYKQKNFTVYGTVTKVELLREKEIVFECETDSIGILNSNLKKGVKLICKLRDEDKKVRDSVYTLLYPGNSIILNGRYNKGRERRNPGEFDYNKYLNEQGISGILISYDMKDFRIVNATRNIFSSFIFDIRKYIDKELTKLHEPYAAALLKGLLISDRSEIDYETKKNFVNSGVVHVLAVSGLHVVYILVIFVFLFGRFNPYLRSALAVAGLIIFMLINGSPASVVRATIMAVVITTGFLTNRSSNVYNSLALSGLIILIINPNELFNPGFQLSFAAVLSMVILYPIIKSETDKLEIKPWLRKFVLFIAVTLSAQIGTMPFVLAYFNKLSIISLAANILVIPLSGFIISIAFFTLFLNMLIPVAAAFAAGINDLLSFIMLLIVEVSGEYEYAFLPVRQFSVTDAFIFYSFLIIAILFWNKLKGAVIKTAFLVVVSVNILLFCSLDNQELLTQGQLNVMMIDVGQGDAILIQFPNGKTALIDAGEANYHFDNGERVILPLLVHLGIDKIDYGFVSHMDADHYSGFISLLHEMNVRTIIKPPLDTSLVYDIKFEKYIKRLNVPVKHYEKGKLNIGGVEVFVLNDSHIPGFRLLSNNNKSSLLKLVYGKTSFLFTGDIEWISENYYQQQYKSFLKSDVLKVAHHGSITSSIPSFIKYISPSVSLISSGVKNKFNHPSSRVLKRLLAINSKIHRTDLEGAILYKSNGDSVYFVDWRE